MKWGRICVATTSELKISAAAKDRKVRADALVVGVADGPDGPVLLENPLAAASARALNDSLGALGITGARDEVRRLPGLPELDADVLVLAGLGKMANGAAGTEELRRAAGSAVRQLAGLSKVVLALPAPTVDAAAAVAEGAALGAYAFNEHRSRAAGKDRQVVQEVTVLTAAAGEKSLPAALDRAQLIGRPATSTRRASPPRPGSWPRTSRSSSRCWTKSAWKRTGTAAWSASAKARSGRRAWSRSSTPPPGPRPGSRSWARASPSTPAACR
jgi:leucyl aminopeptidase